MNKWSLLLFSVLGLLLLTTSKPNFVDGRLGFCDRSSRLLLSDTRLFIYEPHCAYNTFTGVNQLNFPKAESLATKNVELKRSLRSDDRRRQFEERRISPGESFRALSTREFNLEDSTISNSRDRKAVRETNDLQFRRNLKSVSRDDVRGTNFDRLRVRNNLQNKIDRNARERRINKEGEISEIRDNRIRRNDRPVSINSADRNQESFNRRTFVLRTNIITNSRENIESRLHLIQRNEGNRDMERNILDINTRRCLFRETRLTPDLWRNSERRFKNDDGSSSERLRDSIVITYDRQSFADVRRNTESNGKINVQRQSYDKDNSKEILARNNNRNMVIRDQNERFTRFDKGISHRRTIQRESKEPESRIQNKKRLFQERYSIQRLSRQNSNNRLQEIRQVRAYNIINIEHAEDSRNAFIERSQRTFDQNRNINIKDNNRDIRLKENYISEQISLPKKKTLLEKRVVNSNINNRRNEAFIRTMLERRERDNLRYRLDENEDKDQRRIRQIKNNYNEDNLREAGNTQRRLVRSNARSQEINNSGQIDDNVYETLLIKVYNNRKLVNRLDRVRLNRTDKRASQIRIIQRENQNRIRIRAIKIQENRHQRCHNKLVSNINRNVENLLSRTHDKSDDEEIRNSVVREVDRPFYERRIKRVRDYRQFRREYTEYEKRTVKGALTNIERNRNNVLERGFISIVSSIGNNYLYGVFRSTITAFGRRGNYEIRYLSERRNNRDRREDDLRNERLAQKNIASRNSMSNTLLNNNRRSYSDENNFELLVRDNNRKMVIRSERERFASFNKRSSYLRMIQRNPENRMNYDYRQLMNMNNRLQNERNSNRRLARQDSDIIRVIEDRRAGIPNEKLNIKNDIRGISESDSKRFFYERRDRELEDLTREQDFGQSRQRLVRNRREFTRIEDHSRNNRISEKRGLKIINERPNTRNMRNEDLTRFVERELEFYDSDATHNEPRNERGIRNIARNRIDRTTHRMRNSVRTSINNRDLLEPRSEKQRDVNRRLEYIRYTRSFNGRQIIALRENKDNVKRSNRENNREREARDEVRGIRLYGLQISKDSRFTRMRTNKIERKMKIPSKIQYLPIQHKTQSDNKFFEIKLQYLFYLLQGLYILGVFKKYTNDSNGIYKQTRFPNWFLASSPQV